VVIFGFPDVTARRPAWNFVVTDTLGNALGEIPAATQKQIIWNLSDACTAQFAILGRYPPAALVQETATDLMVYRNGHKLFRGRFASSQDTLDMNTHTTQFTVTDYRGLLTNSRMVAEGDISFSNSHSTDIAWELVNNTQSQSGGNLGITRGPAYNGIGTQQTISYKAGSYIGQNITDLSNQAVGGFDWEVDPNLNFNTWLVPGSPPYPAYPSTFMGRGRTIPQILEFGNNVVSIPQRNIDTTKYANVVHLTGSSTFTRTGAGSNDMTITIEDTAMYTAAFGTAGRWEMALSDSNLTTDTNLDLAAVGQLMRSAMLVPTYQLVLAPGTWDPSWLWVGDMVQVIVNSGRLQDNYLDRVVQIQVTFDDESGEEIVQITTGTKPANLLTRFQKVTRWVQVLLGNATTGQTNITIL
jgi:hypothetical protein